MNGVTRLLPSAAVHCFSGDYLLESAGEGSWRIVQVEAVVAISLLLPLGDRAAGTFIEERHAIDSQPPTGLDEIYVLLTTFAESFGSREAAVSAIEADQISPAVAHVCRNIRDFAADAVTVYTPVNPRRAAHPL